MSDKEKNVPEKDESFEDIFSSLREKYNLEPFGESNDKQKKEPEEEPVFYNPKEDSEIDDFFKQREENYTALYEEVDAKIAGVDDDVLKREAEVFNIHFAKENKEDEVPTVFEDVYSSDTTDEKVEDKTEENIEETKVIDLDRPTSEQVEISPASLPVSENSQEADELEKFDEDEIGDKKKKGSLLPKRNDPTSEKIRKIVFLISVVALIISAGWLINDYFVQPYLTAKQNSEVSSLISDADSTPEDVIEKFNNFDEKEKTVTFASLREANEELEAWIVVPGANISLPVVQTTDNSKYLNRGLNQKYLASGTAFIDAYNNSPFSGDMNTTIYAHNMRDGSMFGSIKNYKKVETYKKNPLVYVYTEKENYVYKIYSVFLTSTAYKDDNNYVLGYTFKNLSSDENFASYMEEIKQRSYFTTDVDYKAGDKILTLSTCDRTVIKNGRLVLVARLVRDGETEEVNTASSQKNPNQKFPNAYYEKNNQKNPYANSVKWIAQ